MVQKFLSRFSAFEELFGSYFVFMNNNVKIPQLLIVYYDNELF